MENNKRKEFNSNMDFYKSKLPQHCQNCSSVNELDIHHIVPLVLGGNNIISNMAILCSDCHGKVHGTKRLNHRKLQKEGIKKAKEQGKHLGRPVMQLPEEWDVCYKRWKEGEIKAVEFMSVVNMKKPTFYKKVKEFEMGLLI